MIPLVDIDHTVRLEIITYLFLVIYKVVITLSQNRVWKGNNQV